MGVFQHVGQQPEVRGSVSGLSGCHLINTKCSLSRWGGSQPLQMSGRVFGANARFMLHGSMIKLAKRDLKHLPGGALIMFQHGGPLMAALYFIKRGPRPSRGLFIPDRVVPQVWGGEGLRAMVKYPLVLVNSAGSFLFLSLLKLDRFPVPDTAVGRKGQCFHLSLSLAGERYQAGSADVFFTVMSNYCYVSAEKF